MGLLIGYLKWWEIITIIFTVVTALNGTSMLTLIIITRKCIFALYGAVFIYMGDNQYMRKYLLSRNGARDLKTQFMNYSSSMWEAQSMMTMSVE